MLSLIFSRLMGINMNYKIILFAVFGLVLLMNISFAVDRYAVHNAAKNCTPLGALTYYAGANNPAAIQMAIDASNNGDTVIVCPGNQNPGTSWWVLTDTLQINKSINIRGNESFVNVGTTAFNDKHLIHVNIPYVNITNFKFARNPQSALGIATLFINGTHHVWVYGNEFSTSFQGSDFGIWINDSSFCTFENNLVEDSTDAGFLALNSDNNTFSRNNVTDGQYGFYLTNCGDDTLTWNNVYSVTAIGYLLDGTTSNTLLEDNTADDITGGPSTAYWDISTSYNIFRRNSATDSDTGFYLGGAVGDLLEENTALDTGVGVMQYGFYLDAGSTGNTLDRNVAEDAGVSENMIGYLDEDGVSNTFTDNEGYGLAQGFYLDGATGDVLTGNYVQDLQGAGSVLTYGEGFYLDSSDNNLFDGNTVMNSVDGDGFWLDTSHGNTVSNNEIYNVGCSGCAGIYIGSSQSDDCVITGNLIVGVHDGDPGIYVDGDNTILSSNDVQDAEGYGYVISASDNVAMSGDKSTNAGDTQFYFDTSTATVSNCEVHQTAPGAFDLVSDGSDVSTGSWLITDYLRLTFSNAVNVDILTMNAADAGAAQTGCNDTENFSKCKLATEGYNVVNVTPNAGGATIDLGVQYDYDKTRRQGFPVEQIVLSEWDVGNAAWASLGWDEFNWMEGYVKVNGITDFSTFGVMTFGDPETVDSGDSGSDKKSLTVEYNVLCPEQKVEVTVEDSDGPVTEVEVKLLKMITLEEKSTDSNGMVVFDLTEAGTYELIASGSKYKTKEASFSFDMCEIEVTIPETTPAEEPEEETPPEEEGEVTSDEMEAATTALSDAESAIEAAKAAGKDTSAAEAKLQEAEQAFHMEQFAEAKQLADEAKALLEAAAPAPAEEETPPVAEETSAAEPEEEPEPAADYSWVLWLVLLVVIVGAGYWYFTKPKGPRKK